jgi:hypothetical protein
MHKTTEALQTHYQHYSLSSCHNNRSCKQTTTMLGTHTTQRASHEKIHPYVPLLMPLSRMMLRIPMPSKVSCYQHY